MGMHHQAIISLDLLISTLISRRVHDEQALQVSNRMYGQVAYTSPSYHPDWTFCLPLPVHVFPSAMLFSVLCVTQKLSDMTVNEFVRSHQNSPETIGKPGTIAAAFAHVNKFISSAVSKYMAFIVVVGEVNERCGLAGFEKRSTVCKRLAITYL